MLSRPVLRADKNRIDKAAGFTLIEMMAVLVIISLMTGVVVLSMPREKPMIEQQGSFMAKQFSTASQTSIISGTPQAFGLSQTAYYFYTFDEGDWTIVSETEWPGDLEISFRKDETAIDIPKEAVPVVVFEPMGLSTVFSLSIEDTDQSIVFSSTGDGKVILGDEL